METRRRDGATEVYRVALMFGICLLHCVGMDGRFPWLQAVLCSCVNGFVFISGYYGIRFMPSKVLRLYTTTVFCGLILLSIVLFLGVHCPSGSALRDMIFGHWFLPAYVFLMCFAPLVQFVLDRVPVGRWPAFFLPILTLTHGWSFVCETPIGYLLPQAPTGNYFGLTLLSVYIVARILRMGGGVVLLKVWHALVAMVVVIGLLKAGTLVGMNFGVYSSVLATALAVLTFFLFQTIPWPLWLQRACTWIGPSMFAVYVFHTNFLGFTLIRRGEVFLEESGVMGLCGIFVTACAIFISALALDVLRRLLCWMFGHILRGCCDWMDFAYRKILDNIEIRLGSLRGQNCHERVSGRDR